MGNPGIDYGMGRTNIDTSNGIRYGCISQNSVCQAWADEAEADYGLPTCPKCGNEVPDNGEDHFVCTNCDDLVLTGDDVCGDQPIGWYVKDDEYEAVDCLDNDILIAKSPFYTLAPFCSPCVPGAGNLDDAERLVRQDSEGVKTYCFGHDWFDDGRAPYPVFRVDTGESVLPSVQDWNTAVDRTDQH